MKFSKVIVHLEEDLPEYMAGIMRIESFEFFSESGNRISSHDSGYKGISELENRLIDNVEYSSSEALISRVSKVLGVERDIIEIAD